MGERLLGDLLVAAGSGLGAAGLAYVVGLVAARLIDLRDGAWQRKHPGRSRIRAASPTIEYQPKPGAHPTSIDWIPSSGTPHRHTGG